MLVLSRKKHQSIMVGDVEIVVSDIGETKVWLGVTAPSDVPVHRREVYDAIKRGEAVDRTPRHTDAELNAVVDMVRGCGCRPNEDDMISAPRAKAMARQVETLQRSIEYLRAENAELRAQIQDKEHVE